jgi:hypothetical protein
MKNGRHEAARKTTTYGAFALSVVQVEDRAYAPTCKGDFTGAPVAQIGVLQ